MRFCGALKCGGGRGGTDDAFFKLDLADPVQVVDAWAMAYDDPVAADAMRRAVASGAVCIDVLVSGPSGPLFRADDGANGRLESRQRG